MGFGQPSVKGLALRHLARREHSRAELERKLASKLERSEPAEGQAPVAEQIARALDDLAAQGLQSDERAAESLLRSQAPRFGHRRLKHTLQARGLAPELIAETVNQARTTELERARALWQRRFGAPAADAAGRAKQARFLAGRGFDGEVIRRVVDAQDGGQELGQEPD